MYFSNLIKLNNCMNCVHDYVFCPVIIPHWGKGEREGGVEVTYFHGNQLPAPQDPQTKYILVIQYQPALQSTPHTTPPFLPLHLRHRWCNGAFSCGVWCGNSNGASYRQPCLSGPSNGLLSKQRFRSFFHVHCSARSCKNEGNIKWPHFEAYRQRDALFGCVRGQFARKFALTVPGGVSHRTRCTVPGTDVCQADRKKNK